jgi:hypothetical protein
MRAYQFLLIFLFVLLTGYESISAQNGGAFAHPLQIEPVAVYNKLRVNGSYWDRRSQGTYEQNRNLQVEGEYIFINNFSVSSSIGRNNYQLTDSASETTWDRWNAGIKYGKVFDFGTSQFLIGGGIHIFDKKRGSELRERENPDYYLIRPNLGIGYSMGRFQIMTEFRFQTETNRAFKENSLEEFRRYYQFGIAPSFALTEKTRGFLELEYREPFDKNVDTRTRFFNLYPGVSYATENLGTFSISLQLALLSRGENAIDKGIRFSYFYFFDTSPSKSETQDRTLDNSSESKQN